MHIPIGSHPPQATPSCFPRATCEASLTEMTIAGVPSEAYNSSVLTL